MIKSVLEGAYRLSARWYRKIFGYPALFDVMKTRDRHRKKALLAYLVKPFLVAPEDSRALATHQNWWRNTEIARILDSMGYAIDVIHFDRRHFTPGSRYDLLLGVGPACVRLAAKMPADTVKLFIMTGTAADFKVRQRAQRLEGIRQRRGCILNAPKPMLTTDDLKHFDAVACMGNDFIAATVHPHNRNVFTCNNHCAPGIACPDRNIEEARSHFLYLAAGDHVRKGLDLLLEVFSSEPDLHLHVCGRLMYDIAFARCYHRELFDTHNIHPLGWMNLLEDDFRRISQQCAFSILPSCEEGQPGSIVASMHAGLVPIVSRECGIDLEDFGIELESCSIEDIRKAVRTASTMSVAELDKTSRQARQTAREKYSEQSFSIRFREILKTVQGMSQSEDIMRGAISK